MNGCWRIRSLRRAGRNCETRILGVGGKECVLTELNQLLTSTGGEGWLTYRYMKSLRLLWVMDFGYRRSFSL